MTNAIQIIINISYPTFSKQNATEWHWGVEVVPRPSLKIYNVLSNGEDLGRRITLGRKKIN